MKLKSLLSLLLLFGLILGYLIVIFNANEWFYHKTATSESVQTPLKLSQKYTAGKGMIQNEQKVIKWLIEAAEQGHF